MDFSEVLKRADLDHLEEFLMHGGEWVKEPSASPQTYANRLRTAQENVSAFFASRYTDLKELDEITGYYDEQVGVYQDVYFEIGLILGAKIAFQIRAKMEELL